MKFKAIIFDMDGTIVHTEPLWQQVTLQLIAKQGYQLRPDEKEMLKECLAGMDSISSCKIIKDLIKSDKCHTILLEEKYSIARQLYHQGVTFINGFTDFHKKVSAIPLKTGIATNASLETVLLTDISLDLSSYFGSHIYSIAHVDYKGKPDPAVYLYAAQQLGVKPSECIAIEDSAHGVAAAVAAGMYCIGINTSQNPAQIQKAHLQVDSYEHIDLDALL